MAVGIIPNFKQKSIRKLAEIERESEKRHFSSISFEFGRPRLNGSAGGCWIALPALRVSA
jgi:hypothetical protein